jgi:hypothetical protein
MHLITLAHHGEAQSIIERFNLERISPEFYHGENFDCLITGEGPFEAAISTSRALAQKTYEKVINLGIAGTLNKEARPGAIHQVRTIYLVVNGSPQFKSFSLSSSGLDLITSFERILSPQKADVLRGLGAIVDREAWGVAMAAKSSGVICESYKLISDVAGTMDACEAVQDKAQELSQELCQFLRKILVEEKKLSGQHVKGALDSSFYFTFSSQKKFENLLHKLSLRQERSEDNVLATLPLEELKQRKMTPKERALELVTLMEKELDPFKGALEEKLSLWKKPFHKHAIELTTDPTWEDVGVKVSLTARSQDELSQKLEVLGQLNLKTFHTLREGKLDVE